MPADRIIQEIVLTGDDGVMRRFAVMGAAGEKVFGNISAAANSTGGKFASLGARFDSFGKSLSNVSTKFGDLETSITSSAKRASVLALAVGGAVVGFAALVLKTARLTEELDNNALAAGLSVKAYQQLANVFEIVGIGSDELVGLFNKMNRAFGTQRKAQLDLEKKVRDLNTQFGAGTITGAEYLAQQVAMTKEAGEQVNAFTRLGISATLAANDPEEAFLRLADAFSKMPAGIEKSALELELFGRAGTKTAAILNLGRDGIMAMRKEAERIAPALTTLQLDIGKRLDDAFDALRISARNLWQQFSLLFGPDMTSLINAMTEFIVDNRTAFLNFGQYLVNGLKPIIDDLVLVLQGRQLGADSLVGKVLADVKELGIATRAIIVGVLIPAWHAFLDACQLVADAINNVFGTNITAKEIAFGLIIAKLIGLFGVLGSAIGLVVSVFSAVWAGASLFTTAVAGLVAIMGPWGILIAAIVIALIALGVWLAQVDWVAFAKKANDAVNAVRQWFIDLGTDIKNYWKGWVDYVLTLLERIKIAAQSGVDVGNAFAQASAGTGMRGGGQVHGPGTGTSDSVWARLSRGEYVLRERAVRHYGVGFLTALNQMRLPRFAAGGLFDGLASALGSTLMPHAAMPKLARAGGQSNRILHLTIDGQTFDGLRGDDTTMDRLTNFAVRQQLRSPGRKPGWQR